MTLPKHDRVKAATFIDLAPLRLDLATVDVSVDKSAIMIVQAFASITIVITASDQACLVSLLRC